jgi:chromate transporter
VTFRVQAPVHRPSIAGLFLVFLRIGLLSFGGGLSGWIFREVVMLRGWLDEQEFMSGLAMSQILPGTNIGNLSVYIGQKLFGWPGAVAALLGLLSGPFCAVLLLVGAYAYVRELPYADAAMEGIAAAAIGLSLIVAARGARRVAHRPVALAALVATFVGVGLLHWSLPIVAAIVGTLSVASAWRDAADEQ